MWKSERYDFVGLYTSILTDIGFEYPDDARDWNRDKLHLQSIMDQDGPTFFTLVLPSAGKHLDRCLSCGVLTPFRLAHFRAFRKGGAIPRLFRVLFLRIFHENGVLRSCPDVWAIRFLRQLFYVAKKVRLPCAQSANYSALQAFWTVEKAIRSHTYSWDLDQLDCPSYRPTILDETGVQYDWRQVLQGSNRADLAESQPNLEGICHHDSVRNPVLDPVLKRCQQVADYLVYGLAEFNPLVFRPKHGPGAVSDLREGADKFSFPNWPDKLESVFGCADFAFADYRHLLDTGGVRGIEPRNTVPSGTGLSKFESPSLLHVVPKTQKGPRLIAAEPVSHQWCQQVVKDYLYDAVRSSVLGLCIDFRRQDLSRDLALQASHSGRLATVDLSEASDRISCWLIERLFRSRFDLLEAFHACRSRWIKQSLDKKLPGHIKLRKFSTMGSALTFPVQSIVFTIVAIGVRLSQLGEQVDSRSVARAAKAVRVFGDDIICVAEDVELLDQVLSYLGLKINTDKTHRSGLFRESCGMDAYGGVDVTPAYVLEVGSESRPNVVASIVDTSNNFHMKGYWRTSEWMVSTLTKQVRKNLTVMPPNAGGLSLSSFCGRSVDHLKKRWNDGLHKYEFKYLSTRSRVSRYLRDNPMTLLQYFVERPQEDDFGVLPDHPLGYSGRPQVQLHLGWGDLLVTPGDSR